jgi:hypothetical protein
LDKFNGLRQLAEVRAVSWLQGKTPTAPVRREELPRELRSQRRASRRELVEIELAPFDGRQIPDGNQSDQGSI